MKKLVIILLAFTVILSFTGCTGKTAGSNSNPIAPFGDKWESPILQENPENNSAASLSEIDTYINYTCALYRYDLIEISQYSFFDMDSVFNCIVNGTAKNEHLSVEQVYSVLRSELHDDTICDFTTFANALQKSDTDYAEKTLGVSKEDIENMLIEYISLLNDTLHVYDPKESDLAKCKDHLENGFFERSTLIPVKALLSEDVENIKEYKFIKPQQPGEEEIIPEFGNAYIMVKVSDGWKVCAGLEIALIDQLFSESFFS